MRAPGNALLLSLALTVGGGGSLSAESGRAEPNDKRPSTDSGGDSGESRTSIDPRLDAVCDGVAGLTGRAVLEQLAKLEAPIDGTFNVTRGTPSRPASQTYRGVRSAQLRDHRHTLNSFRSHRPEDDDRG